MHCILSLFALQTNLMLSLFSIFPSDETKTRVPSELSSLLVEVIHFISIHSFNNFLVKSCDNRMETIASIWDSMHKNRSNSCCKIQMLKLANCYKKLYWLCCLKNLIEARCLRMHVRKRKDEEKKKKTHCSASDI